MNWLFTRAGVVVMVMPELALVPPPWQPENPQVLAGVPGAPENPEIPVLDLIDMEDEAIKKKLAAAIRT